MSKSPSERTYLDAQTGGESFEWVPPVSAEALNHRQLVDYNEHRKALIEWLAEAGKNPDMHEGYAESTVSNYAARLDKFYRWVWGQEGYTTRITHEHAEAYMECFATDQLCKENGDAYSGAHKRKTANAIESLFAWRAHERNGDAWSSDREFSESSGTSADYFTLEERKLLREGSLEYGTIPAYNDLSPEERTRWKAYLAQRLGIPKEEVSPDDWKKINRSWKIPSLMFTAIDVGFRPVGVQRANRGWVKPEKGVLLVPKEDAVKDGDEWEVALTDRTVTMLERWFIERETYPKYDDSDAIWLNRKGNRYNSDTLNYLLDNLCEEVGIDTEHRDISWYSIRHSVSEYVASEGSLAEAQKQLRHKSPQTTTRYAGASVENRRDTLDKL